MLAAMCADATGSVSLAKGEAASALHDLRRAWTIWNELDAPYESARTRLQIGLACRSLGDEEAAVLELAAARQVFADLEAAGDLARADSLLHTPTEHGLSGRELEVLGHLAKGETNRTIAATLVISDKTVARHVSNIFTKLGCSSRSGDGVRIRTPPAVAGPAAAWADRPIVPRLELHRTADAAAPSPSVRSTDIGDRRKDVDANQPGNERSRRMARSAARRDAGDRSAHRRRRAGDGGAGGWQWPLARAAARTWRVRPGMGAGAGRTHRESPRGRPGPSRARRDRGRTVRRRRRGGVARRRRRRHVCHATGTRRTACSAAPSPSPSPKSTATTSPSSSSSTHSGSRRSSRHLPSPLRCIATSPIPTATATST